MEEKEFKNVKPLFFDRIKKLMGNETDLFFSFYFKPLDNWIRINTLKISCEDLIFRLKNRWEISQPFENKEIIKIMSPLKPGELGKTKEHLFGYYYIQDISSMMPVIALKPQNDEKILDLCAAPGSKTTYIAAMMKNEGLLIANDYKINRIIILNGNLQRCGVSNCIVTREDAIKLCKKLEGKIKFDKILVDAPCSGEGTRSDITFKIWNIKMIKILSLKQKKILANAIKCLKEDGIIVYSTCTLSPEENEEVIDFIIKNFNMKVEKIKLPIKTRHGIIRWDDKKYDNEVRKCVRIYPQDNNSEGFFIAKLRKVS